MKNEDFIFVKKMFKKRKKFKQYIKFKGIPLQHIISISITRGCPKPTLPVFDENSPGWNQDLQDFFKNNPSIPIDVNENVRLPSVEETTEILTVIANAAWNENHTNSNKEVNKSCLNDLLVKFAKHKIETNAVDEETKKTLLNMISERDKKVEQLKLKNMFTGTIISLDWDDVMYHLMQKNIEFVEKEYGVKDVHKEITDYYYLYRTYPKIADELWNHPENYISGELIDGAIEFYQELVKLVGEDKIQIVTSSMENVIELKDNMLRERFGINCKIVHSIFGKHKKHEFTKHTLLIDDFVGNIREHYFINSNFGIVFNHMNLEYIKKESEEEGFIHVTTFKEVIENVKKYLDFGKHNLPDIESCPYCNKALYYLKFKPYITTSECIHCKNTIVLEQGWVCDPECESDGEETHNLYTLKDAEDLALEVEK